MAKKSEKKKPEIASVEKQLRADLKKVRGALKDAETKVARWKDRAKAHSAAVRAAEKRAAKLEKQLKKAVRPAKPAQPAANPAPRPARRVQPTPAGTPDASWTVTRLRAEARGRGIAGYSRKTKAQLLSELG